MSSLSLQELNSRLDRAAQEKNDLLSDLSTLEEKRLSVENESIMLQQKLASLMEEKAGIEKENDFATGDITNCRKGKAGL